jgi:hypothetical protein
LVLERSDRFRGAVIEWAHGEGVAGFALVISISAIATGLSYWLVRKFAPRANGFWLSGHSGRPERWSHDGSRWVAAEPSRYGFCVWGYHNDTPEVVCLGGNLSRREVERRADLFLAEDMAATAKRERVALGFGRIYAQTQSSPCRDRPRESLLSAFPGLNFHTG